MQHEIPFDNLTLGLIHNSKSEKGITFICASGTEKISYGELYYDALNMLGGLQSVGLKPGDKALLQLTGARNFITVFWACLLGGVVQVPLPVGINSEQNLRMQKVYDLLEGPVILTSREDSSISSSLPGQPQLIDDLCLSSQPGVLYKAKPDDIGIIQFSSGSTGEPKGVILTHRNLLVNCQGILLAAEVADDDTALSWLPLTHGIGLVGFHLAPLLGMINQVHMSTRMFIENPTLWLELSQQHNATLLISPNFGMSHFLQRFNSADVRNWDLSKIRLVVNGAEPVSPEVCRAFTKALGSYGLKESVIFPGYGMTEAGLGIAFPPPQETLNTITLRQDSLTISHRISPVGAGQAIKEANVELVDLGFPVSGCQLRIVDDNEQLLEEDIIGHIQISGANITSGYYGRPDLTAEAKTKDGWLRTGDVGFLRQSRLYITGRSKDIIFVHGQNYYPQDLERAAASGASTDIAKLAVCGIPYADRQQDDIILFFAEPDKTEYLSKAELLRQAVSVRAGLSLASIVPVDVLPRTASGKLERYKLANWYREGRFDSVKIAFAKTSEEQLLQTDVEKRISELFAQAIGEHVKLGYDFFQMGGDSLAAVMLTALLYDEYQIDLPLTEFYQDPTAAGVARYLANGSRRTPAKPYIIFNEQRTRSVFTFPPMVGLGVSYRGLAAYLSDYAFCCFDFVANEAGISRYADMIEQLQPTGGSVLLGYSSGGNLAFETACQLEKRGIPINGLILLDSYVEKGRKRISPTEAMERAKKYLEDSEPGIMHAYKRMKVEYVREMYLKRLYGYFGVLYNGSNSHQAIDADIHLIVAESDRHHPERDVNQMKLDWQQMTKRPLLTYSGFGSHQEMIKPADTIFSPGTLPKNALIIREILENIKGV